MASIYIRANSPFYWIKFRDPAQDKTLRQSTGFRRDRQDDYFRARELEAEKTLLERRQQRATQSHRFEVWVEPYLRQRYSAGTLTRVLTCWRLLRLFLAEKEIAAPEMVRREHCYQYVEWRLAAGHRNSPTGRKVNRNTAILELKVLNLLLFEAMNRGWIAAHPAIRLLIQRAPVREKDEMSDEQIATVRSAVAQRLRSARSAEERRNAHFLHASFEIALRQACRLSETYFDLRRVDFANLKLTLLAKGGKVYHPPLNPDLVPLLEQWRREGREFTYERPRMPQLVWWKFFHRLRARDGSFENVSFHSLRVTGISRLERAGAPEVVTKKLVNHASTTVHRIYRRVKSSEMEPYWQALTPKGSE